MRRTWIGMVALTIVGMLAQAGSLRAQDEGDAAAEDPGFARFVDGDLLAQAIDNGNAGLAADFTLQLVEGERVLQRSHAGITSEQALAMTLRIARETGDKATLDRLAQAAEKLGKKDWSERLDAARKLGAAARSAALPKISDTMSPEAQQTYSAVYDVVQSARLTGDVSSLDAVAGILPESQDLNADQKAELGKLVSSTKAEVAQSLDPALQKLFGASRQAPAGTLALEFNNVVALPASSAGSAPAIVVNSTGSTLPIVGTIALDLPPNKSVPVKAKPGTSSGTIRKGKRIPKITGSGFKIRVTWTFVPVATYRIPATVGFSLTGAGGGQQKLAIGN